MPTCRWPACIIIIIIIRVHHANAAAQNSWLHIPFHQKPMTVSAAQRSNEGGAGTSGSSMGQRTNAPWDILDMVGATNFSAAYP